MSDPRKNLRKRKQQQKKLKTAPIFYEKTLPKVGEDIDLICKKLDEELAEHKKMVEENNKEIMETMSYEAFLKVLQLV